METHMNDDSFFLRAMTYGCGIFLGLLIVGGIFSRSSQQECKMEMIKQNRTADDILKVCNV